MKTYLLFLSLISFGLSAAPFDLSSDTALVFANEAVEETDIQTDGTVLVSSGGDDLHLDFEIGFAITTTSRFIRIDIENGYFGSALPASGIKTNVNYSSILSQGGGIDGNFAIIEVFASVSQPQTTVLTLETAAFKVVDTNLPVTISYTLYGSASDAVNDGSFILREQTDFIRFDSGLAENFTQAFTMSVGFGTDFLRFNRTFRASGTFGLGDSDGDVASIAKFRGDFLIEDGVRRPVDSALITDFRDLLAGLDTSAESAFIQGDFSLGAVSLNASDDCTGGTFTLTNSNQSNQVDISLDTLFNFPVLCIDLSTNSVAINRAEYQLNLGTGLPSSFFGRIRYDGSSIEIPYLTTYSNYKQKLFLTNHAGYDISYKFVFVSESYEEANFTALSKSVGVIPAGTALKLDSTDIVEISEGFPTRLSARLFVDSLPEDISAAAQIVSLGSDAPPVTNVLEVREN